MKASHVFWQANAAAAQPIAVPNYGSVLLHDHSVALAHTHARTDGQVRIYIEQGCLDITANNVELVVRIDGKTLSRGLPGRVVGIRTWCHGDVEANGGISKVVICPICAKDLSSTIAPEESWRLSGVVAGKLEALPEAARIYPEGVEEFGVPAAGAAVSQ